MLKIKYYKLLPGGNATILVEDQNFSPEQRVELAKKLMHQDSLCAEQVGFIRFATSECPDIKLEMMGGEFCGNACRAFGALLALENKMTAIDIDTKTAPNTRADSNPDSLKASLQNKISLQSEEGSYYQCSIQSSGVSDFVELRAFVPKNQALACAAVVSVGVPLNNAPVIKNGIKQLDAGVFLVELSGILHLLLDEKIHNNQTIQNAQGVTLNLIEEAAQWRARFKLNDHEAVGVIWCNMDIKAPSITPVVWVKAMNVAHLETACASGSLALALHLKQQQLELGQHQQEQQWAIMQPSASVLKVNLPTTELDSRAWLEGVVNLVSFGSAFL